MNRVAFLGTAGAALLAATGAAAQVLPADMDDTSAPAPTLQSPGPAPAAGDAHDPDGQGLTAGQVAFSAATSTYDPDANTVTLAGDVRMLRDGNRLRADTVIYDRNTGGVTAEGHVAVTNPGGDTSYSDKVVLDGTLKNGVVENVLLVLADGGRLAAVHGVRKDNVTTLTTAAYSPCPVVGDSGCPRTPVWEITALRVVDDGNRHRIYYRDAHFQFLGRTVLWLPAFSHPDGTGDGGGDSGALVPNIGYSKRNGAELSTPYYLRLAPNRDLTVTPYVYSAVLPMLELEYRQLGPLGAFKIGGYVTYGTRLPATTDPALESNDFEQHGVRGYVDANGTFQLGGDWTLTGSLRYASDKTFLRAYYINSDDRLRNTFDAERITTNSYLSIAGWATEDLRVDSDNGQQPIALPAIDYRLLTTDPWVGGHVTLQANSLALLRTGGQDTQRAFASAQWELSRITPLGQLVSLTGYARADVYHSDDNGATPVLEYQGNSGWETRGIAAVAADVKWPFVGELFGGTQQITPRVQVVASPPTRNMAIPDEDARAIDLDDSNLFALNRFPGYDRWEDGARVTYGGEYRLDLPRFSLDAIVGESYRLDSKPSLFPQGTGLTDRQSDIVGRTTIKYGRFVELTHRYRLDHDTLAFRDNELDLTLGSTKTYITLDYLKLNRGIDEELEDLRDREEVEAGGRIQLSEHWSLFGSTVIDLTGPKEDPTVVGDGFSPVRHRVGLDYDDPCFEFGVTLRKDYDVIGDAARGTTVLFRLAFKNLGR